AAGDEMPAILIAHRQGREAIQLAGPAGVYPVPGAVVAEARCIGNQPIGPEAVPEEDRLAAVPGMTEIPDLVAADDDCVIVARRLRLVEREATRARQGGDRVDELAGL